MMRAGEFSDWLLREAPPHTPADKVDGIMAGRPEAEIRGIAVTWLPNLDVLQRAAASGLNFIIAHEPVFYHHPYFYPYGDDRHYPALDLPEKRATPPGLAKQRVIEDNDLVVYRLHDGWDQFPEHGMGYALAQSLGWANRQVDPAYIYAPEPSRLDDLAGYIAGRLGKTGIRFVGAPDLMVHRISMDWGSPGAMDIVRRALDHGCEAALTGEVVEWRDIEFARDSGVALITGGHCATETPGMQACSRWLSSRIDDVPIAYVDTIDPDHFV